MKHYMLSAFRVAVERNSTGHLGGIRTHDLLLTSADVFTSRPPSLPDENWPARILYSSGFCDIAELEWPVDFFFSQSLGKH